MVSARGIPASPRHIYSIGRNSAHYAHKHFCLEHNSRRLEALFRTRRLLSTTDSLSWIHTIFKIAHQTQEPLGLLCPTRFISKHAQLVLFVYARSHSFSTMFFVNSVSTASCTSTSISSFLLNCLLGKRHFLNCQPLCFPETIPFIIASQSSLEGYREMNVLTLMQQQNSGGHDCRHM